MKDIVDRLLFMGYNEPDCDLSITEEAADEIERLRKALRDILQAERWNEESFRKGCDLERAISMELMSDTIRIARAALGKDQT